MGEIFVASWVMRYAIATDGRLSWHRRQGISHWQPGAGRIRGFDPWPMAEITLEGMKKVLMELSKQLASQERGELQTLTLVQITRFIEEAVTACVEAIHRL